MTVIDTSVLIEAVSVVADSPVRGRLRRFRPEDFHFQTAMFPLGRAISTARPRPN